jgi:hypothetical protein
VAWNQLVQNGDFADGTNNWEPNNPYVTLSVSNNVLTVVKENTTAGGCIQYINEIENHIYLCRADAKVSSGNAYQFRFFDNVFKQVISSEDWQTVTSILKADQTSPSAIAVYIRYAGSNTGTANIRNVNIIDLTQMFGTTIADYVYSLEQSVEGSGIAWLQSYGFFTKDYYDYDAGSLQSVCTSGRKITALDGTVRTYPIDNEELRGLFKLDANNKLYADGDIYPSSGSGTRKYILINLGDCTWNYNSTATNPYFRSDAINNIKPTSEGLCNKYLCYTDKAITGTSTASGYLPNNQLAIGAESWEGYIVVKDSAYTDAATFKTAMDGVYLVAELATPTTFSADSYINPQRSEGTEEFVDGLTRDVMVPVGNESTYFMSDVIPIMTEYIDAVTSS